MRSAEKTFITEIMFIDWLQTQFIPKNDQLRIKAHYDGSIVLLIDGHAVSVVLGKSAPQHFGVSLNRHLPCRSPHPHFHPHPPNIRIPHFII
jgi:hypothetical protein